MMFAYYLQILNEDDYVASHRVLQKKRKLTQACKVLLSYRDADKSEEVKGSEPGWAISSGPCASKAT